MDFITILIIVLVVILVIYLFANRTTENFFKVSGGDDKKCEIKVFVSQSCPHCHTYMDNEHSKNVEYSKENNHDLQLHISGSGKESDEAFEKYNVEYIPACLIVKGDKVSKVEGGCTMDNIKKHIEKMN